MRLELAQRRNNFSLSLRGLCTKTEFFGGDAAPAASPPAFSGRKIGQIRLWNISRCAAERGADAAGAPSPPIFVQSPSNGRGGSCSRAWQGRGRCGWHWAEQIWRQARCLSYDHGEVGTVSRFWKLERFPNQSSARIAPAFAFIRKSILATPIVMENTAIQL